MDIGPLVQAAAAEHNLPLVGMVALGQAESTWTRTAERYGEKTVEALACLEYGELEGYEAIVAATLPDVSWGGMQITLGLARSYGYGDGTPTSALAVREALFNWETSIEIGADYYEWCLLVVRDADPSLAGDDLLLAGMVRYNSGAHQEPGNWWYQRWAANVATYGAALKWAHEKVS